MARFGLIGNPIIHSKSPALFAAAYPDMEDAYELIEASGVEESLGRFFSEDFKGINVTSPYKDLVMKYVTCPDRISSLLGSANVLLKGDKDSDGRYVVFSYNTDYYGVKNTISDLLEGCLPLFGGDVGRIENVLVIGAGGAGKAAALAMRDSGFNVCLANRSAGAVAEFASKIGAEYLPLDKMEDFVTAADLVIYSLSFLVDGLKNVDLSGKIVFEANYAKPVLAPECGVKTKCYIGGRWWLYHQAIPAFELFTGIQPNLLRMREIIGVQ